MFRGWKVSAFDVDTLLEYIENPIADGSTVEEKVHDVMGKMVLAMSPCPNREVDIRINLRMSTSL